MLTSKYKNLRIQANEILKKKSHYKNKAAPIEIEDALYELELYQIELEIQNEQLRHQHLELEISRNKYLDLYDDAPIGYYTLNSQFIILDVNKMGGSLIGYTYGQLLKKYFSQYVAHEYQEIYQQHQENVLKKSGIQTCELKLLRKNGESFFALISSKMVNRKNDDNSVNTEILSFVKDISSRKEAEIWIREKQKNIYMINNISVIEQMANRLSDDINQPLSVLINYINGCKRQLDTVDVNRKGFIVALNQSLEAAYQAITIINRMKHFSISRIMNAKEHALDPLIQDTITILKVEFSEFPIKIYYDVIGQHIKVIADKIYLQQVFLNIARHAIEHMRQMKTIRPRLNIEANVQTNKSVLITLSNNSNTSLKVDLNKEDTLNANYLSVSESIVEAHGGKLTIHSHPDSTHYTFTIPMRA